MTIIGLLLYHYIFDFLLQTDSMALNKSKDNLALSAHCIVYASGMLCYDLRIGIILLASHFIIDYITSRVNTMLWKKNLRRSFFNVLGFDQFLHVSILILTFNSIGGNK